MKNYEKPIVEFQNVLSFEKISSLSDWLATADNAYANAGITTYLVES